MLSVMRVKGTPHWASSQVVRRPPCSSGRVSLTTTLDAVALVGGLQHAEGRTEAGGGGERTGVAVMQYALAGRKQVGPGFGQRAMPLFVVGDNLVGNFQESGSNGRERIRTLG